MTKLPRPEAGIARDQVIAIIEGRGKLLTTLADMLAHEACYQGKVLQARLQPRAWQSAG